ncbi:MAG: sugar-transfer associated ATP-grasp domain-containing protein [Elusimicrobiota bacterium]
MRNIFTDAGKLQQHVLGINRRNLDYIYKSNKRKHFPIADDKVLTKEYLHKLNVPVPETFYVIRGMGDIRKYWPELSAGKPEFVIKPAKGRAGGGILVLRKNGECWETPSGVKYNGNQIKKQMADILFGIHSFGLTDKVLVESRVVLHHSLRTIYPDGMADIRVIVYNDIPKMSMLRMSTLESGGRANLSQGAIGIGIDLKTGELLDGYDVKGYITKHPDSKVEFKGMRIPFWADIIDISTRTSRAVPLNYLGIDVIIDDTRGPVVMEINARPGLEIQNVNRCGLKSVLENG